ncbi:MAG: hypothetical protein AB1453_03105 [Chloroflexota bacterium]
MKRPKLAVWIALIVLAFAAVACEFSATTANIGDAWLSSSEDGSDRVTHYAPDAVFYAQVDLKNAPDDTVLKAVWSAVEVEGVEANTMITETEITTGSGLVHFNLSNDNPWPAGKYKVEIFMNGESAATMEFEVQ